MLTFDDKGEMDVPIIIFSLLSRKYLQGRNQDLNLAKQKCEMIRILAKNFMKRLFAKQNTDCNLKQKLY